MWRGRKEKNERLSFLYGVHCIINYSPIPYTFGLHRSLLIRAGGKHAKQLYPKERRESTSGHPVINSTISWHDYRPCCTFLPRAAICYLGLEWKTYRGKDRGRGSQSCSIQPSTSACSWSPSHSPRSLFPAGTRPSTIHPGKSKIEENIRSSE